MHPILKEFRDFAVKGNAVDLAVGVIIGAAFGKIVTSLVEDIIMPPLSFIIGRIDFISLVWKIDYRGQEVILMNYGKFLNATLSFLIVAWAVFFMVKLINRLKHGQNPAAMTKQEILLTEIRDTLQKKAEK